MGDGEPYLFYFENRLGSNIGYIFLKRPINHLSFLEDDPLNENYYDIITISYGYGGPLYDDLDKAALLQFRKEFQEYCIKENIITEFIRFHPLLQNHNHLEGTMEISFNRETIFVVLDKSEEEIYNHYHKNHRRNIAKAIKNDLQFRVFQKEELYGYIEEFYKLYRETMDKLNASEYSYFSTEYLYNLVSSHCNNCALGAVFFEDKLVGAALCLYEGGALHYHLGCSSKDYLSLGTNIYLLHKVALWGREQGLHTFHLGGGHVGRDSLFQFKHRFNLEGTLNFYIGKKVHRPEIYRKLIEKWENFYSIPADDRFFPVYRNKVEIVKQKTT